MALHYESPRYTTDVDFSTPEPFSEAIEEETVSLLKAVLPGAGERLGHDVECRLQGHRVVPNRHGTRVNLTMRVGYAMKGTAAHRRLVAGQAPHALTLDFSFKESVPTSEEVAISNEGHICVYGLTTLVAEKLRALLQQPLRNRYRRQDVFDLDFLLCHRAELALPEWQRSVLHDLVIKCDDRDVPLQPHSFDDPEIARRALQEYDTLEVEIDGVVPAFGSAFERVQDYFRRLPWGECEALKNR